MAYLHRKRVLVFASLTAAACAGLAMQATPASAKKPAPPRYYVQVLEALTETGVPDTVKPEARNQLIAALKARPEVVLAADTDPKDEAALAAQLKKRKLKGFALSVRVLELTEEVRPPPEGKRSQILLLISRVSIFGSTIPKAGLAIGGDGMAKVGLEVGNKVRPGDRTEATRSALSQSLVQAVDSAISKLDTPAVVPKPEKRKKK